MRNAGHHNICHFKYRADSKGTTNYYYLLTEIPAGTISRQIQFVDFG